MKLGIVGSGMIVHDFLSVADQVPNLELVAISTTKRSEAVGKSLARNYGIQKTYTDNEELFSDPDVDTVYVAVPNSLHFEVAKAALMHDKNVICEKPFVATVEEALELKQVADDYHRLIVEAITNVHLENYKHIKEAIAGIAPIHIVSLNYTQYSSRYDSFLEGEIAPVFDPARGGGALMDLNIYNIHLAVGLFGKPSKVNYEANMQKGVDTSGILQMSYPDKQAVLIASKDSFTNPRSFIEGEKGTIYFDGSTGTLTNYTLELKAGASQEYNFNQYNHRMISEFVDFVKVMDTHDQALADKWFNHTLHVLEVLVAAKA